MENTGRKKVYPFLKCHIFLGLPQMLWTSCILEPLHSTVETVARYRKGEKYFSATDQKYFSTKYYLYFFL